MLRQKKYYEEVCGAAGCTGGVSVTKLRLCYPIDSLKTLWEWVMSMASNLASVMLPPHCVDTASGTPHSIRSFSKQRWPNLVLKIEVAWLTLSKYVPPPNKKYS